MSLVRSQILFEELQITKLRAIAEAEGRSLSEVVRAMVDRQLRQHIYTRMAAAAQRLVADYAPGGELTDLIALDAEPFGDE